MSTIYIKTNCGLDYTDVALALYIVSLHINKSYRGCNMHYAVKFKCLFKHFDNKYIKNRPYFVQPVCVRTSIVNKFVYLIYIEHMGTLKISMRPPHTHTHKTNTIQINLK